jgi:SH3-like domain-containing protein
MFAQPGRTRPSHHHSNWGSHALLAALGLVVLLAVYVLCSPAVTYAADSQSGLPLPRFVTTKSTPINVRVGPGTKYDVAWIYVKAGLPVEIVQEFDTWRKIRDLDGQEGWVHQNLLQGTRSGYVAPWLSDEQLALHANSSEDSGVRAWLAPGFQVEIVECDGTWCVVNAVDHPPEGRSATYSGYLKQGDLWGVYEGEVFD